MLEIINWGQNIRSYPYEPLSEAPSPNTSRTMSVVHYCIELLRHCKNWHFTAIQILNYFACFHISPLFIILSFLMLQTCSLKGISLHIFIFTLTAWSAKINVEPKFSLLQYTANYYSISHLAAQWVILTSQTVFMNKNLGRIIALSWYLVVAYQSHNKKNDHLARPRVGPKLNAWVSRYHYPRNSNKQLLLWKISSADNQGLPLCWLT